jgi:hypothetical protein
VQPMLSLDWGRAPAAVLFHAGLFAFLTAAGLKWLAWLNPPRPPKPAVLLDWPPDPPVLNWPPDAPPAV